MQTSPRHSIVILALGALSACSANDRLLIGEILDNANQGGDDDSPMSVPTAPVETPMTPPSEPPSMERAAAQAILDDHCEFCHSPGRSIGFDSVDIDDLIAEGLIIPGSSASSPIVVRMVAGEMPPGGATGLAAEEIQYVADFVDSL